MSSFLPSVLVLMSVVSCGGEVDAGSAATGAGAMCNSLVQQGNVVTRLQMRGDGPGTEPGMNASGVYVLDRILYYGPIPSGAPAPARVTLEIGKNTIDRVTTEDSGEQRATYTYVVDPKEFLTLTKTCEYPDAGGVGDVTKIGFDARDPRSLSLFPNYPAGGAEIILQGFDQKP